MINYSRFVNWGIFVVLLSISLITILSSEIIATEKIALNKRDFSADEDYSSEVEKQIRAGLTSTADLIVESRPRLWMRGNWDWDYNNYGSFAWRIVHGTPMDGSDPANDQEKYEFCYVFLGAQRGLQGGMYSDKFLYTIVAAEAVARDAEWNLPRDLPGSSDNPDYDPQFTEDEFLKAAKDKLLERSATPLAQQGPWNRVIDGSVGYDWLVNRKYSDGVTPVLSRSERITLQNNLIAQADYVRSFADGSEQLFESADICDYVYVMVGLALYEPSGDGISPENNARAKLYLDEFDKYWVGIILPALNEQGGTGGWHSGLCQMHDDFDFMTYGLVLNYCLHPILFAHYTAAGQPYENSIYSTGALKYSIEFQMNMAYPDGEYLDMGNRGKDDRYRWVAPMFAHARRRFCPDPEQQFLAELAGWVRNELPPPGFVNAGSWDQFAQLIWEDKWPNARSPEELEYGTTRHFAKLGWVCMRSKYDDPDALAGMFICQRYHWSNLNPYAQNSINLERKGKLIKGFENTIWLDDQYQREIGGPPIIKDGHEIIGYPTVNDGVGAYAPGSEYDVGPGILNFETNDEFDYMFGDATNAYDANKLEKFTRGVAWVKTNNVFVIFDRVVTKNEDIKKRWVIEPGSPPQTMAEDLYKITNGAGALWIKKLLPEQSNARMLDDKFEVVSNQAAKEDYFLHVLQAVDANYTKDSPEVVADDAQLITKPNQIGVKVDGWKIFFDKSGAAEVSTAYTNVKNESKNKLDFELFHNYPNPFNPSTKITYKLPVESYVHLSVYNILGQKIRTLVNSTQQAGIKAVKWDGLDDDGEKVNSGVYFYKLEAGDFVSVKKMLFIP